jgi:hypothetical protein
MTLPFRTKAVPHIPPQKLHTAGCKNAPEAPQGSVLLGVLKSIETELRKRDLLGVSHTTTTPLWFLAETERNVFLWRSGKSIEDHRDFTFWVDIKALVSKRREQLHRNRGFNPFISSMWTSPPSDTHAMAQEHEYLDSIEDLTHSIFKHAEALSHASESVRLELAPDSGSRVRIVLPTAGASAPPPATSPQ